MNFTRQCPTTCLCCKLGYSHLVGKSLKLYLDPVLGVGGVEGVGGVARLGLGGGQGGGGRSVPGQSADC